VVPDGKSSEKGPLSLPPFLQLGKGGLPDIAGMLEHADPIAIETAMGGTGGGCVETGPFKDIKLRIGPMGKMDPSNVRCLRRNFNPRLGEQVTKVAMKKLMESKTFGDLRMSIEMPFSTTGAPFHTVGHQGIGGEV
jgi:tyrosinase